MTGSGCDLASLDVYGDCFDKLDDKYSDTGTSVENGFTDNTWFGEFLKSSSIEKVMYKYGKGKQIHHQFRFTGLCLFSSGIKNIGDYAN